MIQGKNRGRKRASIGIHLFFGLMAASGAGAQAITPIGQIGDTVAGVNLAVGQGGGLASCGEDNLLLEGREFENGLSRIRIYFRDLSATVSQSPRSARSTCIIRLRESHLAQSKLTLVYARVLGYSDLNSRISAKLGVSVSSSGTGLATVNIPIPSDQADIGGGFRKDIVTQAVSTECLPQDRSGLFGINVVLSMMSQDGSYGTASADRLDLYVKEEPCF